MAVLSATAQTAPSAPFGITYGLGLVQSSYVPTKHCMQLQECEPCATLDLGARGLSKVLQLAGCSAWPWGRAGSAPPSPQTPSTEMDFALKFRLPALAIASRRRHSCSCKLAAPVSPFLAIGTTRLPDPEQLSRRQRRRRRRPPRGHGPGGRRGGSCWPKCWPQSAWPPAATRAAGSCPTPTALWQSHPGQPASAMTPLSLAPASRASRSLSRSPASAKTPSRPAMATASPSRGRASLAAR